MAELREMPRIRVEPDKLMEWGRIWHGSEDMASAVEQRTFGFAEFGTNKTVPTATKVRGGYYTPAALADYLCRWAIRNRSDRVLEPSCGDGSFVAAAAPLLGDDGSITAVEIVHEELRKAQAAVDGTAVPIDWRCANFFDVAPGLMRGAGYDAAVGNPPFIRFQYFDKRAREQAFRLVNTVGYRPNGLANAWIAFVQLAAELVRDGGRLAMVVPAELLQVQYAAELRDRLPRLFDAVFVIAFDRLVFPDIQQEVLLLLGDGRNRNPQTYGRLYTRQVVDGAALLSMEPTSDLVSHVPERHTHAHMKWTSLFLEDDEFRALSDAAESGALDRMGELADVGVDVDMLCASMVNSLTFAWAEVCGRSYGGGVLELEPREAERLLVPYRFSAGLDVEYIDRRLRADDLEGALDHGDRALLKDGCGFSDRDVNRARAAWNRLRSRRHRRR